MKSSWWKKTFSGMGQQGMGMRLSSCCLPYIVSGISVLLWRLPVLCYMYLFIFSILRKVYSYWYILVLLHMYTCCFVLLFYLWCRKNILYNLRLFFLITPKCLAALFPNNGIVHGSGIEGHFYVWLVACRLVGQSHQRTQTLYILK